MAKLYSKILRHPAYAGLEAFMFFNILVTFAEFEADLIRMRARKGMAVARAKEKPRGLSYPLVFSRAKTQLKVGDSLQGFSYYEQ